MLICVQTLQLTSVFSLYIGYLRHENAFYPEMTIMEQIHGYIAGGALFVGCLFAFRPIRQRFYELFFKVHTAMYILILINVGLHKPEIGRKVVWVLAFAGSALVAGRLVRFLQMLYHSIGQRATLIPLDGATKIIMDRKFRSSPGDHIFITIPVIRAFESHPFTISDTKNTELCVRRRNGFTAALNEYAKKNPGAKLRVLIEGPFGNIPNYTSFDQVILVAGGVGITFCISIALDIVRSPKWNQDKKAQLHWMVKSECEFFFCSRGQANLLMLTFAQPTWTGSTMSSAKFRTRTGSI
jgi:predicted ferric reductase